MAVCLYASDLSDEEWTVLAPLLPRSHPAGRRQTYPLRRIVDAIFYLLRTGAQWRLLPHEYPPRGAVFYHYAQWREDGTWEQVTQALRESYRCRIGRARQPTAAIIDSQSVRTTGRTAWVRWRQKGQGPQAPSARRHPRHAPEE
jgi:transposase